MKYTTVVISGGALRGFGLLGAIQYIQDREWLRDVHRFIGTSIGAIISYLLCIGYSPTEIMVNMCQSSLFDKMAKIDTLNVIHGMGAGSFSILHDHLEKMTLSKIKKHVSLGELFTRFGKSLVCCTYNETCERVEYLSHLNHPDMDCLTAIRMSANLPFMFDPFVYQDFSYIDGGVANNFPIDQVGNDEPALGIRIGRNDVQKEKDPGENLMVRFYNTILIPIQCMENVLIEKVSRENPLIDVISVSIPTCMTLHFSLTTTDKFDMFSTGYDTARRYFESKETTEKLNPSGKQHVKKDDDP